MVWWEKGKSDFKKEAQNLFWLLKKKGGDLPELFLSIHLFLQLEKQYFISSWETTFN